MALVGFVFRLLLLLLVVVVIWWHATIVFTPKLGCTGTMSDKAAQGRLRRTQRRTVIDETRENIFGGDVHFLQRGASYEEGHGHG